MLIALFGLKGAIAVLLSVNVGAALFGQDLSDAMDDEPKVIVQEVQQ